MKRLALLLLALQFGCASPITEPAQSEGELSLDRPIPVDAEFAPDRVIVGLRSGALPARIDVDGVQAQRLREIPLARCAVYTVTGGQDLREAVALLRRSGSFDYVEPDYLREASVDDPFRSYQWSLDSVGAENAWALSTGVGTVVAVIDTGVTSGPDDGIAALVAGYDYVNGDADPSDDNGHGTHVSGTVAQATDNGVGVAGLAHGASVMPLKALDADGSGYTSDVIAAIEYAVNNGADVINMSLGADWYSQAEADAVWSAYSAGVFVAAAAGNAGIDPVEYPAGYPGAVAVGATRYGDVRASYSNYGVDLDLMAPGGDVSLDDNGDGYADGVLQETFDPTWGYYFWDGTSMATPHVAASAALLMSLGATNVEAEDYLASTATDLGAAGFDTLNGWGLIQPAAAMTAWIDDQTPPVDDDGDGYTDDVDCDDGDPTIHPGATEVCGDGIDQDCDGADEACPAPDDDGDGYDANEDCDDGDPAIHPGATEVCGDGIDQDCDGVDEDCCATAITAVTYNAGKAEIKVVATCDDPTATLQVYADGVYLGDMTYKAKKSHFELKLKPVAPEPALVEVEADCGGYDHWGSVDNDGDGYSEDDDCNDNDPDINPGAVEICGDGIDQDCDGSDPVCPVDNDGDGYLADVDCDDSDPEIHPGAAEICGDGIDQDCDGADEACPAPDDDGDGYDANEDCDDNDPAIHPGAAEICDDGIDQDCDGADEACATCSVNITKAEYNVGRSELKVEATCDDAGATLDLYADGVYLGTMTLKKGNKYQYKEKPAAQAATVEVVADCGGTDSSSVTLK